MPALTGIAWAVLIVSLGSLLAGYVAIANFLAKQVLWVLIVLASGYLASTLIEDVFSSLLSSPRPETGEKARPTLRDQAAVLLSGVGRVAVGLLTITLLLAPFGEGPTDLLQRFDQLRKGLAIGEAQIHPGAVLQALIVLALALLGVKMLKRWLSNRYLPTTELDPGMQLSAVTLFGYAGFVVAVALALSAAGIGLERVAWIASALSVGIGFGLQAIVQNFVSGLILLAERPVQVGDWVSLGGVEGDILRINVRATEIQMSDRSTVIVPNSEFITKTVRNVTRSSPLGLVQIKLPMPLSTDAERARDAILQAFADHADILATPAPNVFLDGLDGGNLIFNAKGYVSSPRAAYGVRSALLFTVLSRLREAGLEVSSPTTVLLAPPRRPGPWTRRAWRLRPPRPSRRVRCPRASARRVHIQHALPIQARVTQGRRIHGAALHRLHRESLGDRRLRRGRERGRRGGRRGGRRRGLRHGGIVEAVISRGQGGIGAQPLRHQRGLGPIVRLAQNVDGRGFQPARAVGILGGRRRLHGAFEVAPQAALLILDRERDVHAEADDRAAPARRHHAAVRRERAVEALPTHGGRRAQGAGSVGFGIERDALRVAGVGRARGRGRGGRRGAVGLRRG